MCWRLGADLCNLLARSVSPIDDRAYSLLLSFHKGRNLRTRARACTQARKPPRPPQTVFERCPNDGQMTQARENSLVCTSESTSARCFESSWRAELISPVSVAESGPMMSSMLACASIRPDPRPASRPIPFEWRPLAERTATKGCREPRSSSPFFR